MELNNIYLIGIVAVVVAIIGVVWLLRDRIIGGSAEGSLKEGQVKGSFKAAPPPKKAGKKFIMSVTVKED